MTRLIHSLILAILMTIPVRAWACAVCFGDPSSPQTHGVNVALITLLAITGAVQAGFVGVFLALWRRAIRHEAVGLQQAERP